ncbi:chalcone isomerase family protein [Shimia sagamensis]|uniref:Chalcone isomerase-like n=1 Tax=Shimia sagamensis TaxID=1566352 RepID=A0ABY1P5H3_9RHOB|nr:chalcone isomerase family protein [Shimia sagamensis]SMP26478.1 Chalcone isomerase-like [Shimia sagamensis]
MHMRLPVRERVLMALLSGAVLLGWAANASANPATPAPEVRSLLGQPQELGAGQFRWLGFKVYEAQLFAPQGQGFDRNGAYALEIEYARKIKRKILLKASMDEMIRIEGERSDHGQIQQKLTACYRDIQPGDRIVASPNGGNVLKFWVNGQSTCTLQHNGIRDRYMAIWLSDKARDRGFAQQVLARQK